MADYESKAVVTKISAVSRIAIKIRYTIEYSEERAIQDAEGLDMEMERTLLFEDANSIVDKQADDILKTFQK